MSPLVKDKLLLAFIDVHIELGFTEKEAHQEAKWWVKSIEEFLPPREKNDEEDEEGKN